MEEMTFEEKLKELERITNLLETDQKGLKESLELYEEGKKLAASLEKELLDAEEKLAYIIKDGEKKVYDPEEDIKD